MIERLDRIDIDVTGSEFEALLREAQIIQELQPVYNVQQQYRPCSHTSAFGAARRQVQGTNEQSLAAG